MSRSSHHFIIGNEADQQIRFFLFLFTNKCKYVHPVTKTHACELRDDVYVCVRVFVHVRVFI